MSPISAPAASAAVPPRWPVGATLGRVEVERDRVIGKAIERPRRDPPDEFGVLSLRGVATRREVVVAREQVVLLVALPVVFSAVEMWVFGAATELSVRSVVVSGEPTRALYHVVATLAIASGAARLWHQLRTGPGRSTHH